MVMWGVGEDDTKGRARPLPTDIHNMCIVSQIDLKISVITINYSMCSGVY